MVNVLGLGKTDIDRGNKSVVYRIHRYCDLYPVESILFSWCLTQFHRQLAVLYGRYIGLNFCNLCQILSLACVWDAHVLCIRLLKFRIENLRVSWLTFSALPVLSLPSTRSISILARMMHCAFSWKIKSEKSALEYRISGVQRRLYLITTHLYTNMTFRCIVFVKYIYDRDNNSS
jgi:hypothetical protein